MVYAINTSSASHTLSKSSTYFILHYCNANENNTILFYSRFFFYCRNIPFALNSVNVVESTAQHSDGNAMQHSANRVLYYSYLHEIYQKQQKFSHIFSKCNFLSMHEDEFGILWENFFSIFFVSFIIQAQFVTKILLSDQFFFFFPFSVRKFYFYVAEEIFSNVG